MESQAEVLDFKELSDEERLIRDMSVFASYKGEEIAGCCTRKHNRPSRYRRALKKLEQILGNKATGTGGKRGSRKEVRQ